MIHHTAPQSGGQMSTVLPVIRPSTSAFPSADACALHEGTVYLLLHHTEDGSIKTWYTMAKAIVWGIVQYYRTETDSLTLGDYRRLIHQVENFLWSLPDPFRSDAEWDEEQCDEWADRIINGVLQTIRPDFFTTQEQEKQSSVSPRVVERQQLERLAMEAQALANWLAVKEMVDDCYGEGKVSNLKVQANFDGVETSLDWIVAYDYEGHILSFDRSLPLFTEDIALLPAYAPQLADDDLLFWIDNRYQIPRISTIYTLDHPPLLTFTIEPTASEKEDYTR